MIAIQTPIDNHCTSIFKNVPLLTFSRNLLLALVVFIYDMYPVLADDSFHVVYLGFAATRLDVTFLDSGGWCTSVVPSLHNYVSSGTAYRQQVKPN